MLSYKQQFIEFALNKKILKFGEFTLKSGRISPYFFNAGLFQDGESLKRLGEFYADAIKEAKLPVDLLFGPAYKGIPIATSTAIALMHHDINVNVAFNRKETKDHGEGGQLIGAPLKGNIIVIDDVVTAGTAFHEVKIVIEQQEAKIAGLIIALDRQEKGQGEQSAIEEIKEKYHIPIISIITLTDLIAYLKTKGNEVQLNKIKDYQKAYGVQHV